MKKTYLVIVGASMVLLSGCNPADSNSDRGMSGRTNSVRDAMDTNMPSAVSTNMPAMATNIPPATGSTNQ